MKYIPVFIIVTLLSSTSFAKEYCYRYSNKNFKAYKGHLYDSKKKLLKVDSVILKLHKPISKVTEEKDSSFSVIATVKKKTYTNKWFFCYENKKGIHHCGGEDDSGQVVLDNNMNMRFWFTNFANDDTQDPILTLEAKNRTRWLKATKIACPTIKNSDSNLFVCYSSKVVKNGKPKYSNCQRVNSVCESLGLKHFGHYLNKKDAQDALQRCKASKPKFVD